ncbi:MAG: hypothetical protein JSV25_13460 [Spirochaetota bacterium]|nr:MAG: hypothetical protein JSV25_13460 [Spirochaetota bacterium]
MDTDRTNLQLRVPSNQAETVVFDIISSGNTLCNMKPLLKENFDLLFQKVENQIRVGIGKNYEEVLQNLKRYREILGSVEKIKSLREQLAESFISYNNIQSNYTYLSDLIKEESFREFFLGIYHDDKRFRSIYNESLDQFRQEYRFRYRNYPFPKLYDDELPFWIVNNGKRSQLKKRDVIPSDLSKYTIFPKASPLTLFLRLHKSEIFLHGVGGANYEWVNDRILERFYQQDPPLYLVLSATFFINSIPERDYPFFFINPELLRKKLTNYMHKHSLLKLMDF